MSKFILDSSALLALIQHEKGWEKVLNILDDSLINTVNYAEVVTKLFHYSVSEPEIEDILKNLKLNLVNFDEIIAYESGKLIKATQKYGLSLGDRACIASGLIKKMEIITADKIWSKLEIPVKVTLIR